MQHHEYECQQKGSLMVWESSYSELEHCQSNVHDKFQILHLHDKIFYHPGSNCTGPIFSPPRDDLVLVSPNDRSRTINTWKWWALHKFDCLHSLLRLLLSLSILVCDLSFPHTFFSSIMFDFLLFLPRVKCKDPRKFLSGGEAQTKCGREKKWSKTTFAECRCEYLKY